MGVLSPAELKRAAHEFGTRVLTVHCGYCLDEQGRVDRNRPIGWLARGPKSVPYRERYWRTFDVVAGVRGDGGFTEGLLTCSKCQRWLTINIIKIEPTLERSFIDDRQEWTRTTLKQLAGILLEAGKLDLDDLTGLHLIDLQRNPDGARDFLRGYMKHVDSLAQLVRIDEDGVIDRAIELEQVLEGLDHLIEEENE